MAQLSISLLGSLQVSLGTQLISNFETAKTQALLAYLAVEQGSVHDRLSLARMLWPDSRERAARNNLRQSLFRLRRAIRDDQRKESFLLLSRNSVQVNPQCDSWTDLLELEAQCRQCRQQHIAQQPFCSVCIEAAHEVVSLYRGDFLEGVNLDDNAHFEEWITMQRAWSERQYITKLGTLSAYYGESEAYTEAIKYAHRQIEVDPLREEAYQQLMRWQGLAGRVTEALATYQMCSDRLARDIGVTPAPETMLVYQQLCDGVLDKPNGSSFTLLTPLKPAREYQLPELLTPIVGRSAEIEQITTMLTNPLCRLITLSGIVGCGKSKLALAVAQEVGELFADGCHWIDLSTAKPTEDLLSVLSRYFDAAPSVTQHLRSHNLLLILDHFDTHLLDTVDVLHLLRTIPQLKIIITARQRLHCSGEWWLPLKGLTIPALLESADLLTLSDRERFLAIELFEVLARHTKQTFKLSEYNIRAVGRIVWLLDGNPELIRLAARWVSLLDCESIANELETNPDFLNTQNTNLILFGPQWGQLARPLRDALQRLASIPQHFTRESAEKVTRVSLTTLRKLHERGLLREVGTHTYQIPLLWHRYIVGQCDLDYFRPIQKQFTRYYSHWLQDLLESLRHGKQKTLQLVQEEFDNIVQAWHWAIERKDPYFVAQTATAYFYCFDRLGKFEQGISILAKATPFCQGELLGLLNCYLGWLSFRLQRFDIAYKHTQTGMALLESQTIQIEPLIIAIESAYAMGEKVWATEQLEHVMTLGQTRRDIYGLAYGLYVASKQALSDNELKKAETLCGESLTLRRLLDDQWGITFCFSQLSAIAQARRDYQSAQSYLRTTLEVCEARKDTRRSADYSYRLGEIAILSGDIELANHWFHKSLYLCEQVAHPRGVIAAYERLSSLARTVGKLEKAMIYVQQALRVAMEYQFSAKVTELLSVCIQISAENSIKPSTHQMRLDTFFQANIEAERIPTLLPAG